MSESWILPELQCEKFHRCSLQQNNQKNYENKPQLPFKVSENYECPMGIQQMEIYIYENYLILSKNSQSTTFEP